MSHLLRIASEHGVYSFDPLEQGGWDHTGGSAEAKTKPRYQALQNTTTQLGDEKFEMKTSWHSNDLGSGCCNLTAKSSTVALVSFCKRGKV